MTFMEFPFKFQAQDFTQSIINSLDEESKQQEETEMEACVRTRQAWLARFSGMGAKEILDQVVNEPYSRSLKTLERYVNEVKTVSH